MKLFIPPCGTLLKLSKPWTATIVPEQRNRELLRHLGSKRGDDERELEFSRGTVLCVDRVYIRADNRDKAADASDNYDSITFRVKSSTHKGQRFWVKLGQANEIDCQVVDVDAVDPGAAEKAAVSAHAKLELETVKEALTRRFMPNTHTSWSSVERELTHVTDAEEADSALTLTARELYRDRDGAASAWEWHKKRVYLRCVSTTKTSGGGLTRLFVIVAHGKVLTSSPLRVTTAISGEIIRIWR